VLVVDDAAGAPIVVVVEPRLEKAWGSSAMCVALVKDRPEVELVDLPCFGRLARLVWRRHRWCWLTAVLPGCIHCLMTIDKATSRPGGSASPVAFRLDPASGVPTYLQLVHQVEHALRLGYLKPGDQLPKVRDVVASLAINPNTVLKAYRDLELKGLAAGRPGQGTFIQATLSQVALPQLTVLRRSLSRWLTAAEGAGLDEDGIVALFTSALRDFYERRSGSPTRSGAPSSETEGVA
jgi:GntR family transcriptional regulator